MGRKQSVSRYMTVRIPKRDYFALDKSRNVSSAIRDLILKEYQVILSGRRKRREPKDGYINVTVGLTEDTQKFLDHIKEFYGFDTYTEAVRIAVEKGVQNNGRAE